ncbi:MAG: hypothetical protein JXB23_13015, partial [Candidatus Aminicenantes bacterium]|nr:hypothetical protein [Candidatus Aminicenantes bacterium]
MKYLFVVPIFFFVSTALLAQERGIIECHERKSITVWEVPESLLVITQLPCRHEVNIVGLERGYV